MNRGGERMENLRALPLPTTVGNNRSQNEYKRSQFGNSEEEWDDEEFEEVQMMMGMAMAGLSEEEAPDVIDALHSVVREVTRYDPVKTPKSNKLPTIGFIQ